MKRTPLAAALAACLIGAGTLVASPAFAGDGAEMDSPVAPRGTAGFVGAAP